MKFTLNRDKVVVSLCGLSVGFKKGVPTHVPPYMYGEVSAIGAIPDEEIDLDDTPVKADSEGPSDPIVREAALFVAFSDLVTRGKREDFTAGGAPHTKAMALQLGWTVMAEERDLAWVKFQTKED